MHACMSSTLPLWSTMLISIILCFSHYFVFATDLIIDEEEANPAYDQTIQEITKKTDKTVNTLITNSSANNRVDILDNLEKKSLKVSEHLRSSGKKLIRLKMEVTKIRNKTKDKQTSTEENAATEVDVSENNDLTEISTRKKSLIENKFNEFNSSENKENKIMESDSVDLNEFLTNDLHSNNSRRMAVHETEVQSPFNTDFVDKGSVILNLNTNNINNYGTPNKQKMSLICHNFINRTCEDIKNMNRLKCRYEQSYVTLDKLCDGNSDCPFESDEKNCYSQVMERFFYVKQVQANVEPFQYAKCFAFDSSRLVLSNQAKTLRNVLENGLNFKAKYKYFNSSFNETIDSVGNNDQKKELEARQEAMANNIALVISSLALALNGALCSSELNNFDTRRSKHLFDIDLDKEFRESLSPPKGCKCKEEFCFNCTHYCKRLCRQKYSLTNWNCQSVNGTSTVSLNLLCDGKLDCIDESDEKGCETGTTGYAKFEASDEIYSNIVNMLKLKATKQHQAIHKKFQLLGDSIMRLQILTTKTQTKLETIKKERDHCYSMLRTIYSDIVKLSDIGNDPEEAYLFLLSINENLGTALKRSHTGNVKIMGNECHCRNGTSTIPSCSKSCAKMCAIEPELLRYYCYGKFNESVTVDKICNGVQDCSNGYDEFNCKKDEICRRHHLVVLRNNLQSIGNNLKGTALGERLTLWKLKVISNLKVLEKHLRPSPQALKNIVEDIIRDLVAAYAYGKKYRRSTADYVFRVFLNISQIILESIKSCRK